MASEIDAELALPIHGQLVEPPRGDILHLVARQAIAEVLTMQRFTRLSLTILPLSAASLAHGQPMAVTSPKQFLCFNIGDDYQLADYKQQTRCGIRALQADEDRLYRGRPRCTYLRRPSWDVLLASHAKAF